MTGYPYKNLGWVHTCGVYLALNIHGNIVVSNDPGNPDEERHQVKIVNDHLEVV